MTQPPARGSGPPQLIYIIRHGEKPVDPPATGHEKHPPTPGPPFGVNNQGIQDAHSLLPRGWQRSGALAILFAAARGPAEARLRTPGTLVAPSYGGSARTGAHRTHQTIQVLSDRLGIPIVCTFEEGQEHHLAATVVSDYSGVVLICWDHDHIPALASALPTTRGTAIPRKWPGHRFDVIWTFTLVPDAAATQYTFGQVPQQLLPGDSDTVI